MPVIDLADYLGMPVQAPANPVFNQTRKSTGVASLDREVDDFYKGAAAIDQLRSLQRLAPVFEAQKAQFAYDEIAQKANDLRKKQEIEAQVERAASELAGGNLNPESDDFAVKYRDLATRNPLAFSDARFSNVAGLYAAQNQNYQAARKQQMDAEARAAQARIDAENSAYAFGVPAGRITPDMSIRDINIERGKVKTAGTGTRGGSASAEERRLSNILNVRAKEYEDAKKRVDDFDLKDTDQEFIDARNAWKEASKKYIQFNETGGVPAAQATQTGIEGVSGRTRPKEQAAAPAPFKDTIKGLVAPKAEDILKVDESEVLQGINDPSADENTYMATISDPNVSLKVKEKALINLRDYVNNPKPKTFANFSEGLQYAEKLENNLNDAEMQFSMEKDKSVANPVWDEVKSVMDSKIKEVAKKLNMTTETLLNSLIENEVLPGDKVGPEIVAKYGNVRSNEVPTRNIFKALSGVDWRNKIPSFEPLKKLPNAYNLGLSSGKTWTDVFDSYIDEKTGSPSQSPQPVQESIVEISTEEEVDALPKGSKFRGPDGEVRIK
jgi:hypothetical protein